MEEEEQIYTIPRGLDGVVKRENKDSRSNVSSLLLIVTLYATITTSATNATKSLQFS